MSRFDPNVFDADKDRCGFAELRVFNHLLELSAAHHLVASRTNLGHCNRCIYCCSHCCERCSRRWEEFRQCAILVAGVVLGKDAVSSGAERDYWKGVAGVDAMELPSSRYLVILYEAMGDVCKELYAHFKVAVNPRRHQGCQDPELAGDWHKYLYAVAEVGLAQHALTKLIRRQIVDRESAVVLDEMVVENGIDKWLDRESLASELEHGFRWVDDYRTHLAAAKADGRIEIKAELVKCALSLAHIERAIVELRLSVDSTWRAERIGGKVVLRNRVPGREPDTLPLVIGELYGTVTRFASQVKDNLVWSMDDDLEVPDEDDEGVPDLVNRRVPYSVRRLQAVSWFTSVYAEIRCELACVAELTGATAGELGALADDCTGPELSEVFGPDAVQVRTFLSWFHENALELQRGVARWVKNRNDDIAVEEAFRRSASSVGGEDSDPDLRDRQLMAVLRQELAGIDFVANVARARRCQLPSRRAEIEQPEAFATSARSRQRVSEWTQAYGYHYAVSSLTENALEMSKMLTDSGSPAAMLVLTEIVRVLGVVHRSQGDILRD